MTNLQLHIIENLRNPLNGTHLGENHQIGLSLVAMIDEHKFIIEKIMKVLTR